VADHREAAGEGGAVARGDEADRRADAAVEPAAALEQEAPVPLVGQRQREADRVVLAVGAFVRVERAFDAADARAAPAAAGAGPAAGPRGRGGDMRRAVMVSPGRIARPDHRLAALRRASVCEAPAADDSASPASKRASAA
jgi:hypothetical protein